MASTSETMLSNQTHPGDSSTQTVEGNAFKGDGYYSRTDGFHTVQYNVTGFIGSINIQASLSTNPTATDWFTLSSAELVSSNDSSAYNTGSFLYNFTGNYVWLRAVVEYTDGTVNSISLNH